MVGVDQEKYILLELDDTAVLYQARIHPFTDMQDIQAKRRLQYTVPHKCTQQTVKSFLWPEWKRTVVAVLSK